MFFLLLMTVPLFLWGQLHTFDLDDLTGTDFNSRVQMLMQGTGLSLGHHPLFSNDPSKRLRLGFSLSYPVYFQKASSSGKPAGIVPLIDAGYLVTSNLILTGKISGFASGEDVVQITSYGGILFIDRENQEDAWVVNINFAYLQGPRDIYLRSSDALIRRQFHLFKMPIQLGFGTNLFSGRVTLDSDDTYGARITGQTNYLYIGEQITGFPFGKLGLHCHMHPHTVNVTLDIVKEMK